MTVARGVSAYKGKRWREGNPALGYDGVLELLTGRASGERGKKRDVEEAIREKGVRKTEKTEAKSAGQFRAPGGHPEKETGGGRKLAHGLAAAYFCKNKIMQKTSLTSYSLALSRSLPYTICLYTWILFWMLSSCRSLVSLRDATRESERTGRCWTRSWEIGGSVEDSGDGQAKEIENESEK